MKKQIISLILCIGMILTLIPAFATTTETAPSLCNVLYEEDFEGDFVNTNTEEVYAIEGEESDFISSAYGQGEKVLFLSKDATNANNQTSTVPLSIKHNPLIEGNEGNKVDISFDWNPVDYEDSSTINSTIQVKSAYSTPSNIAVLQWTALDDGSRNLTVTCGRSGSGVGEETKEFDLIKEIGPQVADIDHVYRIRIVIEASKYKSKPDPGSKVSVYVDGKFIFSFINLASVKEKNIGSLVGMRKNKDRGTIDNIKVVEYGTDVTGTTSYINDDKLVSAIREWEYNLSSYEGAEQAKLSSALDEAKAAFEAGNRTQATIDAAVTKLNDWQKQEEESEWSAEVSGINDRTVTIKANEEITDGKIILANYSGSYVVNATLPEFTGLAADKTMDITVPETWTGEVRVFFWDAEYNALMDCEKLTIE